MKTILHQKLLKGALLFCLFFAVNAIAQSTVTMTNLPSVTYNGVPTGSTISAITRGSGASDGMAGGSISGAGFNTASPEASYNAAKYYTFNITAAATHNVSLTQIVWLTQLSSSASGAKFTVKTVNNNGTAVNFGTASQSNASTNTFNGSVTIAAGTTLKVYLIPSNAGAATGTVRVKDNSTFTITATTVAVAPTITSTLTDNSIYNTTDSYTITASGNATGYSATIGGNPLPTGISVNASTGVVSITAALAAGTYNIEIKATNTTGSDTKTLVYTRNKASQTITFLPNSLPARTAGGDSFELNATASSGLPVTYVSSNEAVATVSGNLVTPLAAGSINITALQSGSINYNAATSIVRALTVNPAPSLSTHPESIIGLDYFQGAGPSVPLQLSNVTGSNMSPVSGALSIVVTSGIGAFEVSNISNSGFGSSTSFSYPSGSFNVNNPAIYVRLKSGLPVGEYTGTVTVNGGGGVTSFTVSGEVKQAATMLTDQVVYGPYCNDVSQAIQVGYILQGSFDNANFYVQLSDAEGSFTNNFSNIIGFPNGGTSPIAATINTNLPTGKYRVRVLQVSNTFVPTFSTNDNGSDIDINAVPTLATVMQHETVCSGNAAQFILSGLLPNVAFSVGYKIGNESVQVAFLVSEADGKGFFTTQVSDADNGETITITALTRTDVTPSCTKSFNIQTTISVNPLPVISGISVAPVCEGEPVNVIVSGLVPGSISELNCNNSDGLPVLVEVTANNSGNASFQLLPGSWSNGNTLEVSRITRLDLLPACERSLSGINAILSVYSKPTAVLTGPSVVCAGNNAQLSIALTGAQPWSITYTNGANPVTVNNIIASPYIFEVSPALNETYMLTALNDRDCNAAHDDLSGIIAINLMQNTWTGAIDSSWDNQQNWSCGIVPGEFNPASIANTENNPVIDGHVNIRIKSLELLDGAVLTVKPENNLHVSDAIVVSDDAKLAIENNSNLTQSGISNLNRGPVTIYRDAVMRRFDYVYWGSPVEGQNLKVFSPLTLSNRFYTLEESTNLFIPIVPESNDFEPAKGYMIRASNFLNPNGDQQLVHSVFTGKPNNGNISVAVAKNYRGYNMISNPYPSTIDVDAFLNANQSIETLYFWTHMSSESGGVNYATCNATGATNVPAPSGSDPASEMPNGTIQTGQGFLVKVDAGGTLYFNNEMRVNNNDGQFYRNGSSEKSRIWLRFSNQNVNQNKIMIGYVPNATNLLDEKYDAELIEAQGTRLYSMLGNSKKYVIQGRALPFEQEDSVTLGYTAESNGNYTIAMDNSDGIFSGNQEVYLKDSVTGITHDIKNIPYSFTSGAGTFNERFIIVYQSTLVTENPEMPQDSVAIYTDKATIHINSGKKEMKSVQLYDMRGRLIFENTNVESSSLEVMNPVVSNQVLLVRIILDDNTGITKKIAY